MPDSLTLLLASSSPARLATLRNAGIPAAVRVSEIDEDAVLSRAILTSEHSLDPAEQVVVLARAKAEDVALALLDEHDAGVPRSAAEEAARTGAVDDATHLPPSGSVPALPDFVLGCDSMLELDGSVMGKPRDAAQARDRWLQMRGRDGVLHTGHWLMDLRGAGRKVVAEGATSSTRVHFAHLSEVEIDAYLATGEPLKVAGAFTIDALGGPYVTRIEGDHHGVVGLSLPVLRDLLGRRGVEIHELWATR
ncbi:MAG TPA: septum formation inhibitor Maf [Actinomycetales bacterium]|nr:septum formation inhibitor Maf [Actinomycetales bacterium]